MLYILINNLIPSSFLLVLGGPGNEGATKLRSVYDDVNVKTDTSTANVEAGVLYQNKSTCNLNEEVVYSIKQSSVNAANSGLADEKDTNNEFCPIYDTKWSGADDKFASTIMHVNYRNKKNLILTVLTPLFFKNGGNKMVFNLVLYHCKNKSCLNARKLMTAVICPFFEFITLSKVLADRISFRPVSLLIPN